MYISVGADWRPCVHLRFVPPKNASHCSPGRIERQCYVRGGFLEAADLTGHRNCTILLPNRAVSSHIWWRKREESTKTWALSGKVFPHPPSWDSLGEGGKGSLSQVSRECR